MEMEKGARMGMEKERQLVVVVVLARVAWLVALLMAAASASLGTTGSTALLTAACSMSAGFVAATMQTTPWSGTVPLLHQRLRGDSRLLPQFLLILLCL